MRPDSKRWRAGLSSAIARLARDATQLREVATQDRHQAKPDPLHDKGKSARALPIYQPSDFTYDAEARTCVCPAGKVLYRKGQPVKKGLLADQYQGAKRDCGPCAQRAQCVRTPEKTPVRQVAFFHGRDPAAPETHTARMRARIATPEGPAQYAERFGAAEPVFGNLRFNKGLDRFTLRGRAKVDGQWTLFRAFCRESNEAPEFGDELRTEVRTAQGVVLSRLSRVRQRIKMKRDGAQRTAQRRLSRLVDNAARSASRRPKTSAAGIPNPAVVLKSVSRRSSSASHAAAIASPDSVASAVSRLSKRRDANSARAAIGR